MNILHLTQSEGGGAGRAAMRLHLGLLQASINSTTLVTYKESDLQSVVTPAKQVGLYKILQSEICSGILKEFFGRTTTFSVNATPSFLLNQIENLRPDIINLHWISREFLKLEELQRLKTPLIWTLHDMWAFTGGCNYSGDCDRYTNTCGACPQLASSKESDLTRWVWNRKAKAWKNLNLTIVSPSTWLAERAKASSLFKDLRIEVIPNGLDTQKYQPFSQQVAREVLNLPQDKQLVLFGALNASQDKRKGFQLLLPALQSLSQTGWSDRLELVVFGASEPENPPDLGFKCHYLGQLKDNLSLALAYSSADVMVVPSYQEAFGQTASESMACGTPVVAFNATGLKDIVDHQQNGYLAKPYEVEDLAQGIVWILENTERHQKLRFYARKKAEKTFSLGIQASRYLSLYTEILANK
ncbi:glycosyltransferase family 4 protein [Calothrix sp. PCC 7507]|uniref:glycosyltransferase family 4 protein n=1 Tax=Calothrix sp. PCC 7507 TaxID=99598 RepID=UPI00029EEE18|nr:glycosyltransferase family 4 protein [Calothrix sp. PCC 7507]AFY36219.1 glycosyl transferase group 1 [Calothrix sp. PCC 7507]